MNASIFIAVEEYADSAIRPVQYAEADVLGLATVLEQHAFDPNDRVMLVNERATKTAIESRIRRIVKQLFEDDTLYFYYAGHGFSKNGHNYITCFDTDRRDLDNTSVRLDWIREQFRGADCKRIVMFFDACSRGLLETDELRSDYAAVCDEELSTCFDSTDRIVYCSGEASYCSGQLKHGIWAHHVIEAYDGLAPAALERGVVLTPSSLQTYLQRAIPQTLSTTFADKRVQTPARYGADETPLADLSEILAARKEAVDPRAAQIKSITFVSQNTTRVKSLAGFKKTHTVPTEVSTYWQGFVAKITQDEIEQHIQSVFALLKAAFKFKRKDVNVSNEGDGTATIITPYFNYSISVQLDPADPSAVVWRRTIDAIKEPGQVLSDAFAEVFGSAFDTVEFPTPRAVDLAAFVDQIEDLEDPRISIHYDPELTYCNVRIQGVSGEVTVSRDSLAMMQQGKQPPKNLLQSFFGMQQALVETQNAGLIAFDPNDHG